MARDNRCMYMTHACFYVFCRYCVGVRGTVCGVAAIVKNSGFLVLDYVVSLCKGCDRCCIFCLYCEACGAVCARVWEV